MIAVIGGTTGLGFSAARAFIAEGARVVCVGRDPDSASQASSALGEAARVLTGDATDSATAERAIEAATSAWGRFDGLYHVAGGSGRKKGDGPLHEITDEGWDATLRLNLDTLFKSNRAAIRYFVENGQAGSILNMGSVLGFSPSPQYFATHAYAATKAAAEGLTTSAAAYYAPYDIRINLLAPALVETPMARRAAQDDAIQRFIGAKQPLDGGRIGRPEDLDAAAVYFLSDAASFVTGQILYVDGGWRVTEGPSGHPSSNA